MPSQARRPGKQLQNEPSNRNVSYRARTRQHRSHSSTTSRATINNSTAQHPPPTSLDSLTQTHQKPRRTRHQNTNQKTAVSTATHPTNKNRRKPGKANIPPTNLLAESHRGFRKPDVGPAKAERHTSREGARQKCNGSPKTRTRSNFEKRDSTKRSEGTKKERPTMGTRAR